MKRILLSIGLLCAAMSVQAAPVLHVEFEQDGLFVSASGYVVDLDEGPGPIDTSTRIGGGPFFWGDYMLGPGLGFSFSGSMHEINLSRWVFPGVVTPSVWLDGIRYTSDPITITAPDGYVRPKIPDAGSAAALLLMALGVIHWVRRLTA